jgi:translin
MQGLDCIADQVRKDLEARNVARDEALTNSRQLIRNSANTIRAVHRGEYDLAADLLTEAGRIAASTKNALQRYPDLYWTGYVQDAQKEFSEARLFFAMSHNDPLPGPRDIGVEIAPYLNGLGEAAGEMRRYALDLLRRNETARSELALESMDDIYSVLVTIDFPDALTGGLRRTTDMVRGVLEKTRGDLTMAVRQADLEHALGHFEAVVRGEVANRTGEPEPPDED